MLHNQLIRFGQSRCVCEVNCISDQQQKVDDRVIYHRLHSGIPVIHGGEHVNLNFSQRIGFILCGRYP